MGRPSRRHSACAGTTRRGFIRRSGSAAVALASAASLSLATRGTEAAAPLFQHGVASGDPLADRVILWTRVTPQRPRRPWCVRYVVATDPALRSVVQRGRAEHRRRAATTRSRSTPTGLQPGTTYYYRFIAEGEASPIGRTRTLPVGATAAPAHGGGELLEPRRRLLQRLPPHRRARRPRPRAAPGRLPLRVRHRRVRQRCARPSRRTRSSR